MTIRSALSTLSFRPLRGAASIAIAAAIAMPASASLQYFRIILDGTQEVPPTGAPGTGAGYATLDTSTNLLTYNIGFSGLTTTQTAAHFHGFAPPGTNAGVIIGLPLGSPITGSTTVTPAQASGFLAGLCYVNVHTTMFPGGEIRGQVVPSDGPLLFTFSMDGGQEVPPVATTATGSGCMLLDVTTHTLSFNYSFSGLTSAQTASHIHGFAPPGTNAGVLFATPLGSPSSGSVVLTTAQEANFLQNLGYVNVHTTINPGGEIRGQMIYTAPPAFTNYCFGDGSGTACPCGNSSAVGAQEGCLNSFSTGGALRAHGVSSISCDAMRLDASGLPPSTSALFFQGTLRVNGGAGSLFGDGLRCAGGSVVRLGTQNTVAGAASYPNGGIPIATKGLVTSPGTRTYQTWYRNSAAFCMPDGFNLTNGVEATWIP